MFDRRPLVMDTLYVGLRAYEMTPAMRAKLRRTDGTEVFGTPGDAEAQVTKKYYYYQYVLMSGRKAHLAQVKHLVDKTEAWESGPPTAEQRTFRTRLMKTAKGLGVAPHDLGAGSATHKKYPFDTDPFDAVRSPDLENMVGAWQLGRILDTRACKYSSYEGGPIDGASGMRVDVQIAWLQARDLPGGSKSANDVEEQRKIVYYHASQLAKAEGDQAKQAFRKRSVDEANWRNPSLRTMIGGSEAHGEAAKAQRLDAAVDFHIIGSRALVPPKGGSTIADRLPEPPYPGQKAAEMTESELVAYISKVVGIDEDTKDASEVAAFLDDAKTAQSEFEQYATTLPEPSGGTIQEREDQKNSDRSAADELARLLDKQITKFDNVARDAALNLAKDPSKSTIAKEATDNLRKEFKTAIEEIASDYRDLIDRSKEVHLQFDFQDAKEAIELEMRDKIGISLGGVESGNSVAGKKVEEAKEARKTFDDYGKAKAAENLAATPSPEKALQQEKDNRAFNLLFARVDALIFKFGDFKRQDSLDAVQTLEDVAELRKGIDTLVSEISAEADNIVAEAAQLQSDSEAAYKQIAGGGGSSASASATPGLSAAQLAAQARSAPMVAQALAARTGATPAAPAPAPAAPDPALPKPRGKSPAKRAAPKPTAATAATPILAAGSTPEGVGGAAAAPPARRREQATSSSMVASVFDSIMGTGAGAGVDPSPASPTPTDGSGSDASGPKTFSKRPR